MAHSDGGRAAPRGWCDCWNPAAGMVPPIRSNHPAAACGRGFPSLSKEGSFSGEFRDRNYLGRPVQMTTLREEVERASPELMAKGTW